MLNFSPPSLSKWWLSWLLQRDHLLNQHSSSPPILRYHNLKHLLLLTMLLRWIYLLKLAPLVLAWKSLHWSMTHDFTLWRIRWTNIRVDLILSLSISNWGLIALRIAWRRGLTALRIAWCVGMRRWWLTYVPCFHLHLLSLDLLDTPLVPFLCCQRGKYFRI